MQEFATEREALDFLAAKIAAEAKRANVPLSEVERKMLYFSETAWTLPDMAKVNEKFEEGFDSDEYEQKIAGLIRSLVAGGQWQDEAEEEAWHAAIARLGESDSYFQVLLDLAEKNPHGPPLAHGFLPTFDRPEVRPPHDRIKLWLTALAVIGVMLGIAALRIWLFGPK